MRSKNERRKSVRKTPEGSYTCGADVEEEPG